MALQPPSHAQIEFSALQQSSDLSQLAHHARTPEAVHPEAEGAHSEDSGLLLDDDAHLTNHNRTNDDDWMSRCCRSNKTTRGLSSSSPLLEWTKLLFLAILLILNIFLFLRCTELTTRMNHREFLPDPDPTLLSSLTANPHTTPRRRRLAVVSMLTNEYCRGAAVLFKSFLRLCPFKDGPPTTQVPSNLNSTNNPNAITRGKKLTKVAAGPSPYSCGVHFVLMYPPSFNPAAMPTECEFLNTYDVTLHPIRVQPVPANSKVGQDNWVVAVDKLAVTGLDMFDRILFIDADTVFVRSLMDYFHPIHDLYQVAGVVDQTDGCERREQLNSGTLLLTPSKYLFGSMQQLLMHGESCLSPNWHWGDQEVYNCLCGMGGSKKAYHQDINCRILPSYWGQMGDARGCDEYDVADVHLIHFAGPSKPWNKNNWDTGSHPQHQYWHCTEDMPWEKVLDMSEPGCILKW